MTNHDDEENFWREAESFDVELEELERQWGAEGDENKRLKERIRELQDDLAAEIEARKEEYNRAEDRQVEVERLKERIIAYRDAWEYNGGSDDDWSDNVEKTKKLLFATVQKKSDG
jgi:hypothetical protein